MLFNVLDLIDKGSKKTGGSFIDVGKKEYHKPFEHYAPVGGARTYAPTTAYAPTITQSYIGATYQISSPGAVSKKETIVRQKGADIEQRPVFDIPTVGGQREESPVSGMSVEKIAIIAVVGAVVIVLGKGFIGAKK